jgi:peptidyl-prolyl cis-trans isomerase SurA
MTLRRLRLPCAALAASLVLLAPCERAEATVIERIVAVVGDKAILLSDLRARAQPFLVQVHQSVPAGAQRNAAISQLYRTVLQRIVDEELEIRAAQQSKLSVTAKEVDDALDRVATQNKITPEQLLAEAERSGLSAASYRDELRRQLLEAKLVNVRLQGRIRVTEEDLRTAYRKLVLEEREKLMITPAWIALNAGSTPKEQQEQRALAERLAEQAKSADFAALARAHSVDTSSREKGGTLPRVRPGQLPPALSRVALGLNAGEIAPAVRVGQTYVVLKVLDREASSLPDFEEARRELTERVYIEKMALAKKSWLDTLRRQHHVEVRL